MRLLATVLCAVGALGLIWWTSDAVKPQELANGVAVMTILAFAGMAQAILGRNVLHSRTDERRRL